MALTLHLDTCAYTAYVRGHAEAVFVMDRARAMAVSPIVIGELKAGFASGRHEERNLSQLQSLLASPRILIPEMEAVVTDQYARIYRGLRALGKPIPTNDLWIAAFAFGTDSALFTLDLHFEAIAGLRLVRGSEDYLQIAG